MNKRYIMAVCCGLVLVTLLARPAYSDPPHSLYPKKLDPKYDVILKHSSEITSYYKDLNIRSLDQVPESDYEYMKKYVIGGVATVVVHPAYYVFFQDNNGKKVFVERGSDFSKNIVDIFLDEFPAGDNAKVNSIKLSLRKEVEFIRGKAQNRELIVLVIPPNYQQHPEYPYKRLDEFGRFLNEVTNGSPSVLYVESNDFKSGHLANETFSRLRRFFHLLKVKTVQVGGEYKDQCVSNFYEDLKKVEWLRNVVLLPEICTVSPN